MCIDSQQVACGAYHSLALVRSLPPKNYNTQNPPEKKERGQSPHYSATDREELFAGDSGHYCPLGVELTEGLSGEVNALRETGSLIDRHLRQLHHFTALLLS